MVFGPVGTTSKELLEIFDRLGGGPVLFIQQYIPESVVQLMTVLRTDGHKETQPYVESKVESLQNFNY